MIKPWLIVQFSIIVGFFLYRIIRKDKDVIGWALYWGFMAVVLFFTYNFWVVCFAAVLISFSKFKSPTEAIVGYAVLLPTMVSSKYFIPFPGMYYLYDITFPQVLVLVVLLPLCLRNTTSDYLKNNQSIKKISFCVYLYFVFIFFLGFRGVSISEGLRNGLDATLTFLIPFLAIRIFQGDFYKVFDGMLFTGLVLAVIAILEWQLHFKPYGVILPSLGVQHSYVERMLLIRDGIPRTSASLGGPLGLGFFLSLISVYIVHLWTIKKVSISKALLPLLVLILAIETTGSRAALLTLFLGVCMLLLARFSIARSGNFVLYTVLSISGVVFSIVPIGNYLAKFDAEGTFRYRVELINNSLEALEDFFWFGSESFIYHPAMQKSMQGQGIIDIVNVYLGVWLEFGFITLVCFLLVCFFCLHGLHSKYRESRDEISWFLIVWLFCVLFFIATCSAYRFIPIYTWLLIGLIAAYLSSTMSTKKRELKSTV